MPQHTMDPGKPVAKRNGFFTYLLSANGLHKIACVLWLLSLGFITLATLRGDRLYGILVLISGWAATIFSLNVAWLANLFFLYILINYGISRVITSEKYGKLIIPAWLAVACSLHTLFLDQYMESAQAHYEPIYGYGWGAILWFAAIFIMAMAVGKRLSDYATLAEQAELPESPYYHSQGKATYYLGLTLLLALISLTLIKGSYDHLSASQIERTRLENSGAVFTRHPVCTREIKRPIPAQYSNVILRLTLNGDLFPFYSDNPVTYLNIDGVKAVQLSGIEYQYQDNDRNILRLQPITQQPDLDLTVSEIEYLPGDPQRGKVYFTLTDSRSGNLIFRDYWEADIKINHKKPRAIIDRCSEPSPMVLIEKSLNRPEKKSSLNQENNARNFGFRFKILAAIAEENTPWALSAYSQSVDKPYAIGCPADSGFGYQYPDNILDFVGQRYRDAITAFKLNEVLYVASRDSSQAQQAVCKGDAIYTYAVKETILQKRRSADYAIIWQVNLRSTTGDKKLTNQYPYKRWSPYNLMDVNETDSVIQVILYDKESKQWIRYLAEKPPTGG